jgi:glycosyltransferase involved in cell wall biosynthesis
MLKNEAQRKTTSPVRFGFLGVFAERKGLRDLFEMMSMLARKSEIPWELHLAGDAQDATGRALIDEIRIQYGDKPWWRRVFWRGWVRRPQDFLRDIDLLICPSSDFEPCPLVVCEAGAMGLGVLGARTGGIPEIIADGKTGCLYDPGDLRGGAEFLVKALIQPTILSEMGAAAILRVESEFNLTKMVAEYRNIYSNLIRNVW